MDQQMELPYFRVNWDAGELRPAPRKNRPNRREMFYPCDCPRCNTCRWLRRSDALKGCVCRSCKSREIGQKGYKSTVKNHGEDFAVQKMREHRLNNPTQPEREVESYLIELRIPYQREYIWKGDSRSFILDFVILDLGKPVAGIEVNGWNHFNREGTMVRDRQLEREFPLPLMIIDARKPINREAINVFRWELA